MSTSGMSERTYSSGLELDALEDAQLVAQARTGEERAIEVLLTRYRNFARSKARSYFLAGSEQEDVVQEGMIGLYKAIRDFDPDQETPFRAFAELCISRQILTAIKTANRHKHQPLNSSVSLDAPAYGDDESTSVADQFMSPARTSDPAELVISAEEIEALRTSQAPSATTSSPSTTRFSASSASCSSISRSVTKPTSDVPGSLLYLRR